MRSISSAPIASASTLHSYISSPDISPAPCSQSRDWHYQGIDCIHLYVADLEYWRQYFQFRWQFQERGTRSVACTRSLWLSQADIQLVLSAATSDRSPVSHYLQHHPPGVVDVALRVSDFDAVQRHLSRIGYPLHDTWQQAGDRGGTLFTPFGIRHSLVQRSHPQQPVLPNFSLSSSHSYSSTSPLFTHLDHAVLNVARGQLEEAVAWYRHVLKLDRLYQFTIGTPRSGLRSVVMGDGGMGDRAWGTSGLQLPINEPSDRQSQIQEFLDANHGPGIQHVAFHSSNLLRTIPFLKSRGVAFLDIPDDYYNALSAEHSAADAETQHLLSSIRQHRLLLDHADAHRLLLQTFTHPIFAEPTLFIETIERRQQATGFGEGNFQALFEAVEREQIYRQNLSCG